MLQPSPIDPVPEATARVAKAAFRKGNPLLSLRDEFGAVFADADFADLFPKLGRPGLPPWRLALVTLLQSREDLPDRQAAEAVRGRIDCKYLLGLELIDPGFDHSVPCEFRSRLLTGSAEERLPHKLLEACQARGLLKARGRQRTDATHVLASIRTLNRLELLGETLRAALNELATVAPGWLRTVAPRAWYERYAHRVEDGRLPRAEAEREAYARTVGEDGFALLDLLDRPETPEELRRLAAVGVPRRGWGGQVVGEDGAAPGGGGVAGAGRGAPVGARGRRAAGGRRRAPARQGRAAARRGPGRVALRSRGALPHPLGHRLGRVPGPPHRNLRGRRGQPDHARDDDGRHRARGALYRSGSRSPGRQGPPAGRAPGGRRLRRRRAAGREPRGARHRPARPAAAEPGLAGQVVERLGPAGRPEGRRGLRLGLVPRGGLRRLPGAAPVHPGRAGPAAQAAPTGRARGPDGGAAAARDQGGTARLRAAGRDRGHDLAGRARLRVAPQPLPGAGQDPPAARGDRGRDRPPAARRLVPGGPARRHPHLALRHPRDGLSRLRQRYRAVSGQVGTVRPKSSCSNFRTWSKLDFGHFGPAGGPHSGGQRSGGGAASKPTRAISPL